MFQDQELMVKGQKLTNMDPTFYQQQKTQKQPNGAIAKTDSLMNNNIQKKFQAQASMIPATTMEVNTQYQLIEVTEQ